jgi:hypothetical protein
LPLLLLQFGADGALQHRLCRSCFTAAFDSWMSTQAAQHGSWEGAKAACATHLTKQQRRQLKSWVAAAVTDYTAVAADCAGSNGSSGSSAVFKLPSAAHARMLEGREMSVGRDWPVEYCSLRAAKATLTGLVEVVTRLPTFQVPPYSKLGEVRLNLGFRL